MTDLEQELLLAQYRRWLTLKASDLTSDRELAKDLAQEGWIAIWRAYRIYDPTKGSLPAWLTFKARARMLTCLRRLRVDVPTDDQEQVFEELTTIHHDLEAAYHKREVLAAVATLTPRQQEYVLLRFWVGMRLDELARYFGYDPSGLWNSPRNGAKLKLRGRLAHLAPTVVTYR